MNDELIKKIVNEEIKSIKPIHSGVSNSSYLVNDKYVVRIKSEKDHFYNSKQETSAMNKISKLNIGEKLLYLDKDGNKMSEYIIDITTFKNKDEELLKTAKLLKSLHQAKIKSIYYFRPFVRYKYYKAHSGVTTSFPHEEMLLKQVKKIYHHYHKVLCHNDIVDNNLLFKKDKSFLIDYEFASMNIPLFDLASFLSENNITNATRASMFLKGYEATEKQIEDLPYMIMFLNLLWFYWAKNRYIESEKEIYKTIFDVKQKNIEDDLKSLLIYKK